MQVRMQAQGVGAGSDCPAADLKSSGGSGGVAYLRLPGAGGGVQGLGPTVSYARALVLTLGMPYGREWGGRRWRRPAVTCKGGEFSLCCQQHLDN